MWINPATLLHLENSLSYEVIARRWRPKDFSGLIGQDHVRQTLMNALSAGRLHHALLLTGPRGTGKTSTARILAKALRCPNAKNFVPCNKCSECEDINAGRSVNVLEIDGASNNGVDSIRELRDTVSYMPSSGKYKLYIIDEVHMLSTSAFNALLKTLEEPPAHVYFIMATTEVHKIPNTILSRCQRFDFRRVPTRAIADYLKQICDSEKVKADADAVWMIARQADGSIRDSQSLLEQVINFSGGNVVRSSAIEILGLTDRQILLDIFAALVQRNVPGIVSVLEKLLQTGSDPKILMQELMEEVRHALMIKLGTPTHLVDLPDSEREQLQKLTQDLAIEDLHMLFDMALKGANDIQRASDLQLVMEMILLRMAGAPRWGQRAPLQVNRALGGAAIPPLGAPTLAIPTPGMPTAAPTSSTLRTGANGDFSYRELVEKIKEVNGLIGAQLENCFVLAQTPTELKLGIPTKLKFLYDKLNQPDFKKKLNNYLTTFGKTGLQVQIELADPPEGEAATPKAQAVKDEKTQQAEMRQAIENHPLVKSTKNVFKGEIKTIKEIKS
jgi:DNA polymerase-3 subunit gamma/tau